MITTTLGLLVQAAPALERLGNRELMPVVSFKVAKLIGQVKTELAAYETARQALVKQYGTERPTTDLERPTLGDTLTEVRPECREAFGAALMELLTVTVGLDFTPVTRSQIGPGGITPNDVGLLAPFVTDDPTGGPP